jgi:hypothetical protein
MIRKSWFFVYTITLQRTKPESMHLKAAYPKISQKNPQGGFNTRRSQTMDKGPANRKEKNDD